MNVFRGFFGVKREEPKGVTEDPEDVFRRGLQDAIGVWKTRSRGRFELTGHDFLVMLVTAFAGGTRIPGLTDIREPFVDLVRSYFSNTREWMDRNPRLSGNPERAVDAIYRDVQCTLMAYRDQDFIAIQTEPQFSRRNHGKANLVTMLGGYLNGGEEGLNAAFDKVSNEAGKRASDDPSIRYSGGNGSSLEEAVVIHTLDHTWGVEAEYWYLNYTYGRIKKRSQSVRNGAGGRHYDCISFTALGGRELSIYFDISGYY